MRQLRYTGLVSSLMLFLAACGGSSGSNAPSPPPSPPAVAAVEAARFLNQASFGSTDTESRNVMAMDIDAWIERQMEIPASLQLPYLQSLPRPQLLLELQGDRIDIWFRNSIHGPDQLRQRIAFALSQIMVVSQVGALVNQTYALGSYYDMLAQNAFANYRDLIEDVTLHPAMGVYLSMLGNEKPDAALNIRPDENYARELMQLFSIGLVELNIDGTPVLDDDGNTVPTYNQEIIEGFAHVYTGWTYAGAPNFKLAFPNDQNQTMPMQHYPEFHDGGEKLLLNGVTTLAGQTGNQDLADALDNIFQHPNVGPFIATRLIQRLTTSNPSPGYVRRVAEVFNDNGFGVRGDLGAVVKAILLDDEARPEMRMEIDGKLKEPILRLMQLYRAYNAASRSGRFGFEEVSIFFGQGPLQSPSVFNFFSPSYAPPGEIRDSGLVAPELQIATEYQNTLVTNYFFIQAFGLNSAATEIADDDIYIDLSEEIAAAGDAAVLADMVGDKLLAGQMSAALRAEIIAMVDRIPVADSVARAAEAIFLTSSSPEFAYQR